MTVYMHSKCDPSVWKDISTHENPADIPSRGGNLPNLFGNTLWLNGLPYLYDSSVKAKES